MQRVPGSQGIHDDDLRHVRVDSDILTPGGGLVVMVALIWSWCRGAGS